MANIDNNFRRSSMVMSDATDIGTTISEQEREVLAMVVRHLQQCKRDRVTGKATFEICLKDGGIVDKWAETRVREK